MIYFTSDWHLGEKRLGINGTPNLFYRPFKSTNENDFTIVNNFLNSGFENGDTLYFLGDMFYEVTEFNAALLQSIKAKFPKSKFILVLGNYDTEDKMQVLVQLFGNAIIGDKELTIYSHCPDRFYLNHYPVQCKDFLDMYSGYFGITAHIHSLWKVQRNMINVSVDAWHFKPVSEEELFFCYEAIKKYYDLNVFPL